jgi:hypothetical protein
VIEHEPMPFYQTTPSRDSDNLPPFATQSECDRGSITARIARPARRGYFAEVLDRIRVREERERAKAEKREGGRS